MAYPLLVSAVKTPLMSLGSVLAFLLSPVTILAVFLGGFVWACITLPIRILIQFETLYIYGAVAAITGITVGIFFAVGNAAIFHILSLNRDGAVSSPATTNRKRGRRKSHLDTETSDSLTRNTSGTAPGDDLPLRLTGGFAFDGGSHESKGAQEEDGAKISSSTSSLPPFLWRRQVPPASAPAQRSSMHGHPQKQIFPILEEEDELEESEGLSASQLRRQHMRLALSSSKGAKVGRAMKKKES